MSKEVLRGFNVRVPPAQLKLIAAWAAKQPVPPTMSEAIRRLAEIGIQNSTGVLHRILRVISETTHEKIGADPVLQRKIAERLKEVENELKVEPGPSDWLMIQQGSTSGRPRTCRGCCRTQDRAVASEHRRQERVLIILFENDDGAGEFTAFAVGLLPDVFP